MSKAPQLRAGEGLFSWLMLAFSAFVLIMACRISGFSSVSSPGTFPMLASGVMVLSTVLILAGNRKARKPDADGFGNELRQAAREVFSPVFLIFTALILAYMLVMQPLTFLPSSFAFLLASIIFLKGSTPLKSVFIAAGMLGGIYVVFHYLFRVVLP